MVDFDIEEEQDVQFTQDSSNSSNEAESETVIDLNEASDTTTTSAKAKDKSSLKKNSSSKSKAKSSSNTVPNGGNSKVLQAKRDTLSRTRVNARRYNLDRVLGGNQQIFDHRSTSCFIATQIVLI